MNKEESQEKEVVMKKCTKCKKDKEATTEFFYKDKTKLYGLDNHCSSCRKAYRATYKESAEIREARLKRAKVYREDPKNKEHIKYMNKAYMQRPDVKAHRAKKARIRRKNKPLNKLQENMSRVFNNQLKLVNSKKPKGTLSYVGCSKEALEEYFNSGKYTLDDYHTNTKGNIKYDCDHIIPTSYFLTKLEFDEQGRLTKETEPWLYKWWNYRNLRIWPSNLNRSKGDNIDMDLVKEYGIADLLTLA